MKTSYGLTLLLSLAFIGGGQAAAQSQMGQQIGDVPQFTPSTGWSVQKSTFSKMRVLEGINLPCMMMVGYDNGYGVRLSGTNQNILAMAIDFRQNVFSRGRRYPATIKIGSESARPLKGTAFSESVLIFNVRELDGFYNQISSAPQMTLDIEGNPMSFSLSGVSNGLAKLDACSNGGKASQTARVQKSSIPKSDAVKSITWNEKVTPMPARVSNEIKKQQEIQGSVWEAKAGDSMKATLEGWASRANVDLDWQATGPATVSDDIRVVGSFEEAVQALMARNAAALGLDANMKGSTIQSSGMQNAGMMNSRSRVSAPQAQQVSMAPQSLSPSRQASSMGGGQWSASMGSSLEKVLENWSRKAGVEFVWQSNQGFSVKSQVSAGGSYEQALENLLGQYMNEKIRPAVQLNNDPVTGRRTLFVQSSRVL